MNKFEVDGIIKKEMEPIIRGGCTKEENPGPNSESLEDPWEKFFEKYWKKIFVTSCVLAVLLDPLFLYTPQVYQKRKCLDLDKYLKVAAVTLRSLTDLFYIADIVFRVYGSVHGRPRPSGIDNSSARMTLRLRFIITDICAILPIPQVLVLVCLSKTKGTEGGNAGKTAVNAFVLAQYVPRVLRIYQLFKELRKTRKRESTAIWVKGALNFFMYILASHVVGALWYFFAVQQMKSCWQQACIDKNVTCQSSTFRCNVSDDHAPDNMSKKMLNEWCPLDPEDKMKFDFGIFQNLLKSNLSEAGRPVQKFSNCFWFGLRHLSSLGSNLEPSTYSWENIFAAFISITGLLLFLYLIGNLQTYMQLETARSEERRYKMQITQKLKKKRRDCEFWLYKKGIPERSITEIMPQIMENVQQELEENKDVNVENLLSILPLQLQIHIQGLFDRGLDCHPLTILKKVPRLQNMDEKVLKAICECLKRKSYSDNECIVKNGRLEMMLLITDGAVEIEGSAPHNQGKKWLKKGDFYGEELLDWVNHMAFSVVPISTDSSAYARGGHVEALILMAEDLNSVVLMFRSHFSESKFPVPENASVRLGLDKLPYFTSALRIE